MTTKPKRETIADRIAHLCPCRESMKWADGYTSPAKAWAECKRGDWMLWLAGKCSGPPKSDGRKTLVLAACECARLALTRYENRHPTDNRVRNCIDVAERWAKGEATIIELREARTAADAADADAAAYAAAYAADAAAYAADAAYAAADAAADAADAAADADADADAAADAAAAAADADADARSLALAKCADIVRKHYPKPPRLTA